MKKIIAITTLALAAAGAHAKDVVDTAVAAGDFKTLAAALEKAGLVEHAQGQGPVHRVRPDRRGVRQGAEGGLEALLADKAKLAAILTYHVVPGKRDGQGRQGRQGEDGAGQELTVATTAAA